MCKTTKLDSSIIQTFDDTFGFKYLKTGDSMYHSIPTRKEEYVGYRVESIIETVNQIRITLPYGGVKVFDKNFLQEYSFVKLPEHKKEKMDIVFSFPKEVSKEQIEYYTQILKSQYQGTVTYDKGMSEKQLADLTITKGEK